MSTAVSQIDEVKTTPWAGGTSPFSVEYGKIMMWFFLLSDAFTFSSLLIAYGALRFSSAAWPAPDLIFQSVPGLIEHGAPLVFVGLMTFILIMSSVTMVLAVEAGHRGAKKEVVWWMIGTIIGGFMFLGCQALEWSHLHSEGFWWGSIPRMEELKTLFHGNPSDQTMITYGHQFANLFFTITGFHGFHVFIGMLMLTVITLRLQKGHFTSEQHFGFEGAAWYWHFVDVVWLGLYILVYWL